jgi:hypothetical protein
MKLSPFIRLILLTLTVIFLTALFVTFYFSESPWESPSFQNDSEVLVTRKIQADISPLSDLKTKGGFLFTEEGNVSTKIQGLYTSQVGLQGLLLNFIQEIFNFDPLQFISASRIIVSLFFAITIAIILYNSWVEFGSATAVIVLLLVASAYWLVAFSKNLYWVAFTMFLPFAIGWYYYPRVTQMRSRFSIYLIITAGLILLKSLNGYEYITNVILGASIGPLYYELKTGTRIRLIIKRMALIIAAGITGFGFAYGIHFLQLLIFIQDFREAVSILIERAVTRTIGINPYTTACDYSNLAILVLKYLNSQSIFRTEIPLVWMFSVYAMGATLLIPHRVKKAASLFIIAIALTIIVISLSVDMFIGKPGLGITQLLAISVGICILLFGILSLASYKPPRPDKLIHLAYTTTWALISSFSWVVLAKNHMACHLHINPIVFYLPFGITLFIFLGYLSESIASDFRSDKKITDIPRGSP